MTAAVWSSDHARWTEPPDGLVVERPGWMAAGACRGSDPALFFPVGKEGSDPAWAGAAKAVCARCPVREECLDYALANSERFGIWGGLTQMERRAVKRGRRAGPRRTKTCQQHPRYEAGCAGCKAAQADYRRTKR